MVKLSLCMITYNEELFIQDCIESIYNIVDEIIVVDSKSTDDTVEIAKSYGAKIFYKSWENSFSKLRNYSIKKASGDWILVMDADERIATLDHKKIIDAISQDYSHGFYLCQRDYTDNISAINWHPVSGEYPEYETHFKGYSDVQILRLFKNRPDIYFSGVVHESVELSFLKYKLRAESLPVVLHHYQQKKSEQFILKKQMRYFELNKLASKQNPRDFKPHYDMGLVYANFLNDRKSAIRELKISIKLNPKFPPAYSLLAKLLYEENKLSESIKIMSQCVRRNPKYSDGYINLANLYISANKPELALKNYKTALKLGTPHRQYVIEKINNIENMIRI